MNTDELERALVKAGRRVLEIQAKLHGWAVADPHRRFDDLMNLVADPAFLLIAWDRVRGNKGAKTAGVDGHTASSIMLRPGVETFLGALRASLKDRSFQPLPARERLIPKPGTAKRRRLGISTIRDRVVQASLKLVLEPIFEAEFLPCSYGFRPNHRVHDAVSEVRHFTSHSYEWIVEGDIRSCFDEISHPELLDRVRRRIGDRRVLALVKAFLKAGILTEEGALKDTDTGTPQGSILSPLLSNVALAVLDEHFAQAPGGPASKPWERAKRRRQGLPNHRLVRFADDWALAVAGTRDDAQALREEAAQVLARIGLHLSEEKTLITHIDEGLDFLGWRIQRHRKKGTDRHYVYTYPSRKALRAVMAKVKTICRQVDTNHPLDILLLRINPVLRGWTTFFRPGVSSVTFQYLDAYVWRRVIGWICRKHAGISRKELRRRYCDGGWWPKGQDTEAVPHRVGTHDPVPLPGIGDPLTLAAGSGMRTA